MKKKFLTSSLTILVMLTFGGSGYAVYNHISNINTATELNVQKLDDLKNESANSASKIEKLTQQKTTLDSEISELRDEVSSTEGFIQ